MANRKLTFSVFALLAFIAASLVACDKKAPVETAEGKLEKITEDIYQETYDLNENSEKASESAGGQAQDKSN